MQLNKLLKGLAIALPLFTLAACSTSDSEDTTLSDTNKDDTTSQVIQPSEPMDQMTEEDVQNNALRQTQTVYFNFDDSSINNQFDEMLGAHAAFLRANSNLEVVIEGHADERGTPEYNIALGERRTIAVAKYLQALGVPSSQIEVVSFGEEKPLKLGHTPEDYKMNRRAVLVY